MKPITRRDFTARSAGALVGALLTSATTAPAFEAERATRAAPRLIVRGDDIEYEHTPARIATRVG